MIPGFLVALFARDDEHFASAVEFLASAQRLELHSLWLVVAEASFFLDIPGKVALLDWLERLYAHTDAPTRMGTP